MGSNVERYAVLLAGPLLLCAWAQARMAGCARRGWRGVPALVLALCAAALWVVWGPARETAAVAGSEATSASYYAPVERFLAARTHGAPVRIEVPLTRSALGGGAAGAERVAGARVGEAARRRATTACCWRRA